MSLIRPATPAAHFIRHYLEMVVAMVVGMVALAPLWSAAGDAMGWSRAAAMYLPFLVLFPPLWLGVLSPGALTFAGHVLMLPAMAGVMLLRPSEYIGHHP